MENGKIYVIGLGPGGRAQMTERAVRALEKCGCIAGYGLYLELIAGLIEGKERIETGMTREIDPARRRVTRRCPAKRWRWCRPVTRAFTAWRGRCLR